MSKKRKILIGFVIFILLFAITSVCVYTAHKLSDFKIDPKTECIEDGNCKEGLSIKVDKDKIIIINKDTCTENGGKWYEETKMCIF